MPGLQCIFDVIDDLGYPETTNVLGIPIDYSDGTDVFLSTFESEAKYLVPVDTGFLQSTIGSFGGASYIECFADADYASYVEWGTYRMYAQPYFEPAILAAWGEAAPLWDEAIEEAKQEEQEQLAAMHAAEGGGGSMSIGGFGGFLGLLVAAFIIGLVQGFFSLFSSNPGRGGGGGGRGRGFEGGGDPTSFIEER